MVFNNIYSQSDYIFIYYKYKFMLCCICIHIKLIKIKKIQWVVFQWASFIHWQNNAGTLVYNTIHFPQSRGHINTVELKKKTFEAKNWKNFVHNCFRYIFYYVNMDHMCNVYTTLIIICVAIHLTGWHLRFW